ncbi:MAG TPA: PHP-associated domain-containing protein [Dehalococcoidia bacterium]|nr:PHP-associated domain-containing protein [Dehalococcoidia bacterium]
MARIDTHVHGLLSKSFSFSLESFADLVRQGITIGLDGFALTEHFHAPAFWAIHDALRARYPYRNGAYEVGGGFRVLSGAELDVAEGGHIGLIGPLDRLRVLDERFRPMLSGGQFPTYADLRRASEGLDLVIIANHMLRPSKSLERLTPEEFATVSAFELNGKDHEDGIEERIRGYARRYDKPLVGGSDAHVWAQVGVRSTIIPGEASQASLRRALGEKTTDVATRPNAEAIVQLCSVHKQIAKLAAQPSRSALGLPARRRPLPALAPRLAAT